MRWKFTLSVVGMATIALIFTANRYRNTLDIALSVPWKVHCPWVEEIPAKYSDMEYNKKLFKAFHVFRSGKGKYGLKERGRYDCFDGAPEGIRWLLIEDGKAECGMYGYFSTPRPDRRQMHKYRGTAMTIGYFPTPPGVSRTQGRVVDGDTWVEDERGLAITNERYGIQFTAPERRGGF